MTVESLILAIDAFVEQADILWQDYQSLGPGKLSTNLFDQVDAARERVLQLVHAEQEVLSADQSPAATKQQLDESIDTICKLSDRCANRPEGLNFIAGEWGLIPQKEKIKEFEDSLALVKSICDQLKSQAGS